MKMLSQKVIIALLASILAIVSAGVGYYFYEKAEQKKAWRAATETGQFKNEEEAKKVVTDIISKFDKEYGIKPFNYETKPSAEKK